MNNPVNYQKLYPKRELTEQKQDKSVTSILSRKKTNHKLSIPPPIPRKINKSKSIVTDNLVANQYKLVNMNVSNNKEQSSSYKGVYIKQPQAVADLPKIESDFRQQLQALQQTHQQLEKYMLANKELEQFANTTAHDLKEPLRSVIGFAQLLHNRYHSQLDAEGQLFLNYILSGATHMHTMIEGLLEYAKIDNLSNNRVTLYSLDAILERVQQDLHFLIAEKRAIITTEALPDMVINSLQIRQLFQNLLSNAIKFCDQQPHIHVGVREQKDCFVFSIQDNGIGIDKDFYHQIFHVFRQLNEKGKYAGVGMGLAICKKIVAQHGGDIWLESTEGEGTTFFFSLRK